jgi:pimeloyl-ACP methyl ester carboxylesterase
LIWPGHGRSADWDERGDYQAVSTAIAAGLIDGAADIIGHSFGGTVALRLALERPEKVRSLVLIEPVCFAAARMDARGGEQFAQFFDQDLAGLIDRDAETATREFSRAWGTGQAWEDIEPDQRRYMIKRIRLITCAEPQLHQDRAGLLPRLPEISVPVMLVQGERSPPIMAAICDALAGRIARARRVTIPGAGHMAPVTHPIETARAIAGFLGVVGTMYGNNLLIRHALPDPEGLRLPAPVLCRLIQLKCKGLQFQMRSDCPDLRPNQLQKLVHIGCGR